MKQEKRRRMRKLGAGPGRRQALDIPHYKTLAGNFAVPPSNSRRHSGAGLATAFLGKLAGSGKGRSLPDTSHNGAGMSIGPSASSRFAGGVIPGRTKVGIEGLLSAGNAAGPFFSRGTQYFLHPQEV